MDSFYRFLEVHKDDIDNVISHLGKVSPSILPFNNIFGDKYRILIDLRNNQSEDIKKSLEQKGYRVDLASGMAYKKVKTNFGEKEVATKIGKLLTPEQRDTWSKVANSPKNITDDYSIVLSRHPIDVLRMSDHTGISSCHAAGASYYNCAINDAKNGGLIAYLVDKDSIKLVNLQDNEIFKDKDRNQSGIIPEGRLRVRRFTNGKIDLAIPELRTYGGSRGEALFDGFQKQVTHFMKEKQKDLLSQRLRAKDFKLRGGSYQDNPAGELFNNFFGDKMDRPMDTGGLHDDENEDIAEQRRTEIAQIDEENKFKNHVATWYTEEDEWTNVNQMFFFDGVVKFYLSEKQWVYYDIDRYLDIKYKNNKAENRQLFQSIANTIYGLSKWYTDIEKIEFDHDEHGQALIIRLSSKNGGPDDYGYFLQELQKVDRNYFSIRKDVEEILTNVGLLTSLESEKNIEKLSKVNLYGLKHVIINYDDMENGLIGIKFKLTVTTMPELHLAANNTMAERKIKEAIDGYMKSQLRMQPKQKFLPFKAFINDNDDTVDVATKVTRSGMLHDKNHIYPMYDVFLELEPHQFTDASLKQIQSKIRIIDNNFSTLENLVNQKFAT